MARHKFPDDPLAYGFQARPGSPAVNAMGMVLVVFADQACTQFADIASLNGAAIVNSRIAVNAASEIPDFLGPDDDTFYGPLWARPEAGGEAYPIWAKSSQRFDAVEARVSFLETSGVGGEGPPGPQGVPGPQGPPGPPGDALGSAYFVYQQAIPADTWYVVHNLGFKPSVTVVDSANHVWDGADITYPDNNTVVIALGAPFAGAAYLS